MPAFGLSQHKINLKYLSSYKAYKSNKYKRWCYTVVYQYKPPGVTPFTRKGGRVGPPSSTALYYIKNLRDRDRTPPTVTDLHR